MTMSCKGCGTPPGVKVDPITFVPHCIKCNGVITVSLPAPAQQAQNMIFNIPTVNTVWIPNPGLQITGAAAPSVGYTIAGGLGSLGAGIDSLATPQKQDTPEEAYDRAMGVIK